MNNVFYLLFVVRFLAFMPLILMYLCFLPIMYLLGISDPLDKWVMLNEGIVFNKNGDYTTTVFDTKEYTNIEKQK